MKKPIRVLLVEDSEDDALLLIRELRRQGYDPTVGRTETAESMRRALNNESWDIIISDYVLPRFSGIAALEILKEIDIDLPFIIVSGKIGEEVAVDAMKAGAHDYVMKENLQRLAPAVERELHQAVVRCERRAAEEELRRHRTELELLVRERTADLQWEVIERKRAEEDVRAQREWLSVTLHSIGDAVIATDKDGLVRQMNRMAERLTGWLESEAMGKPIETVFHILNENTREALENPVQRVLRCGTVIGLANHTLLIARGGNENPISDSGAPILDRNGDVIGVVLVFRDQTAERAAAAALKDSEKRYRRLFESAKDGILILDAETGIVLDANPFLMNMLGSSIDEFRGKRIWEMDFLKDIAASQDDFNSLLEKDYVCHEHLSLAAFDGRRIDVEFVCTVYQVDHKKVMQCNVRDIGQRKRAEKLAAVRLGLLEFSASHALDELLQKTLDEVCALTQSPIGFYHFVESDQQTLSLQAWSTRTVMEFCKAEGKGLHYPIDKAGVWVDCAREKKPVIHNDYSALTHRKGMPEGHAEIVRELVVPVIRADQMVAILGIGNKPDDYTDDDVNIVSLFGDIAWTIAERKMTEDALRKSDEQVRFLGEILQNTSQPFAVGYPDGRMGIFNKAFCELTGYAENELRGIDRNKDLTPAEWRAHEAQALLELEGSARAVKYEKEYIRKDGARIPVELLVHAVRDPSGKILFYHAFVTDISERKRTQQEMLKLSTAVEQSPVSVIITDVNGNIEYVNPKFTDVTGYTPEEVLRQNPRILKSGEMPVTEYQELWKTITTGGIWHGEFHNRRKDGSLFWERASISPIRDAAGTITHFVAIKEDITAQKSLEAQYYQAQKMEAVGRLAGGVAHDFNNMLGIVTGYAELARMNISPNDPVYRELDEILKAAKRSTGLVRQLLAFARRQTVEPRVVNMNSIIAESERMLHRLVGEDITIRFVPDDHLWKIRIDPAQVDQILANLSVNARDAIPGVGDIIIETRNIVLDEAYCESRQGFIPGQYVLLSFSDSGIGMEREVLEHIFEPFFTTKEVGKGTGLGLSTIYGIVKQNNGFVNVYSEPGKGTTFRLYLPAHHDEAEEKERQTDSLTLTGTETILVVEDDRQILDLTTKILQSHGYAVIAASLPGEALILCEKHPGKIDLVISDVVMPTMNGKELHERIEKQKPGIKVLYMSGYTANVIAHHGILSEGVRFIQKPFTIDAFLRKVREAMAS